MMTEREEEDLYVHFSVMDTDELVTVEWRDFSEEEYSIYAEVMLDRRDEIDQMIATLRVELNQNKKSQLVRLPAEIIAKLVEWDAAHTSFLDDLTDPE